MSKELEILFGECERHGAELEHDDQIADAMCSYELFELLCDRVGFTDRHALVAKQIVVRRLAHSTIKPEVAWVAHDCFEPADVTVTWSSEPIGWKSTESSPEEVCDLWPTLSFSIFISRPNRDDLDVGHPEGLHRDSLLSGGRPEAVEDALTSELETESAQIGKNSVLVYDPGIITGLGIAGTQTGVLAAGVAVAQGWKKETASNEHSGQRVVDNFRLPSRG